MMTIDMHPTILQLALIISSTVAGLYFGFRGIQSGGKELPGRLRGYDLKLAIIQLSVGVIGLLYLIILLFSKIK
jgi:hypothetical protein